MAVDRDPVEVKECERRHETGPLVPVDKRMVLHDVVQVGRRHPMQILMQEGATERRAWLSHGREKEPRVADTLSSSELD